MLFFPKSLLFRKNNARNINYMSVLIFRKCLDLRKKYLFSDKLLDCMVDTVKNLRVCHPKNLTVNTNLEA